MRIAPGQFVAVIACTQLLESLAHTNVRLWFGPVLERVLVSPRFHRLHHSMGLGHESQGRGIFGRGHNFAVLFPVWDVLFRTANFEQRYDATGQSATSCRKRALETTDGASGPSSSGWA